VLEPLKKVEYEKVHDSKLLNSSVTSVENIEQLQESFEKVFKDSSTKAILSGLE